jgi:WD40 repeat protein/serine/threonine protein kinase
VLPRRRVAHYELIEEIGRGAQGQVFLAQDTRLGRRVALKVLSAAFSASSGAVRRFEREAEIASRLDHPGICSVHEAGEWEGQHYIAMRHLEGETLAQRIRSGIERGPESTSETIAADRPAAEGRGDEPRDEPRDGARDEPRGAAPARRDGGASHRSTHVPSSRTEIFQTVALIERAARTLHAAHEVGLIHRDIKPGNIMVTPENEPVILDFGLARDEEDGHSLTVSGDLLGTPAYMSPEQLLAQRVSLDRRTDIYSLGVTLYECLTLRRPYDAPTRDGLYQRILAADLPDPTRLNRRIPRDLKVVVATALERDRERRYKTALDFAEDLRRVRSYEPILARPAGPVLRFRRFVQRNPVIATATAGVMLLLLTALAITTVLLRDVEQQRALADRSAGEATSALLLVEEKTRELTTTLTDLQEESTLKERALAELSAAMRRTEGLTLAAQAAGALNGNPGLALLLGLEAAERQDTVILRNTLVQVLALFRERRVLSFPQGIRSVSVFSPAGDRFLASGLGGGRVRALDTASASLVAILNFRASSPDAAAFSAGGKRVAFRHWGVAAADVWEVDAGRLLASVHVEGAHIESTAFDAAGERLAAGTHDGRVAVFEAATGRELASFDPEIADSFHRVLFVPGGERLIACTEGLERFYTISPEGTVTSSGYRSNDEPTQAFLIDARTGAKLQTFTGYRGRVEAAVSPDGRLLAIGSESARGSTKLWSLETGEVQAALEAEVDPALVRFSPDSTRLLLRSADGRGCLVLDASTGREVARLGGHRNLVVAAEWSSDGSRVLTGSRDSTARLWDAKTGLQVAAFEGHEVGVFAVAFSPQGGEVFTASADGTLRSWDASPGQRFGLVSAAAGPPPYVFELSPDGEKALIVSDEGLKVIGIESGAELGRIGTGQVAGILSSLGIGWAPSRFDLARFSPDSRRLLLRGLDRGALWEVWSVEPFQRLSRWRPAEPATWVEAVGAISPDGRVAAVAAGHLLRRGRPRRTFFGADVGGSYVVERRIELREVESGSLLAGFEMRADAAKSLRFSADGSRLLVFLSSGGIKVIEVASGEELFSLSQLETGGIFTAAMSPNGRIVACSGWSSKVHLMDVDSGTASAPLQGHSGRVEGLVFSPDSSRLMTFGEDRSTKLWDTSTGDEILTLQGHLAPVTVSAFSADGKLVLTGSEDQRVKVWSLEPGSSLGEEVVTFPHEEAIAAALFDPAAGHVASVTRGGGVHRWPLDVVAEARRRRTRDFTAGEAERFNIGRKEERTRLALRAQLASVAEALEGVETLLGDAARPDLAAQDLWSALDELTPVLEEAPEDPEAERVLEQMAVFLERAWARLPPWDERLARSCEALAALFSRCGHHSRAVVTLERGARLLGSSGALESALARERREIGANLPSFASIDHVLDETEVLIEAGAEWRFFRGKSEPAAGLEWTGVDFADASWERGATGIGYGDQDDATILADMRDGYTTLYLRREVVLPRPEDYSRLVLSLTVDDGFVAYLNSAEVGRFLAGAPGERVPFQGVADSEAAEPLAPVEIELPLEAAREGRNVFALQILNRSLRSSDLSSIPVLIARPRASTARDAERLAAFRAGAAGDDAPRRIAYFEGRVAERAGATAEAAGTFERLSKEERLDPEPFLALARARLRAQDAGGAERALREAIERGIQGGISLWEAWFRVAAEDLRWQPQRLLAAWPRAPSEVGAGERGASMEEVVRALAKEEPVRIRSGGAGLLDSRGRAWRADTFFLGGRPRTVSAGRPLRNSEDQALYLSHRSFGEARAGERLPGYRIPVVPGMCRVTLHFAEIVHPRGGRRFNVILEGRKALADHDPSAAGFFTAEEHSFDVPVADAFLDIELERVSGSPMVSGIEVAPASP